MSKLATIEKIESVSPVENSDHLHKYKVLGWQCVSKSKYNIGDLVVYIRTDTVADSNNPIFEFLEKQNWRIKPIKLRGEHSNGLILPWQDFFNECPEIGIDVADKIGITKYEKPVNYIMGDVKGSFPTHLVSKTDEENIQNIPQILNEILGQPYYATVKLDGSSATYICDENGEFRVCSRTLELKDNPNSQYWAPVYKNNYKSKFPKGIAIQGELCGPKIQNNPLGLTQIEFFMFNAFDIKTRKMFSYSDMMDLRNSLDIPMVPVFETGIFNYNSIDELLSVVQTAHYNTNGKNAEGLVFRLTEPRFSDKVQKELSFKVINPKYKD